MYRLALVVTLLAACGPKPAASPTPSPEPGPEPTSQEPGPTPTSEEPPAADPSASVDTACYEECMAYVDDDAGCTAECTTDSPDYSADDCFDDCMLDIEDADTCSSSCY